MIKLYDLLMSLEYDWYSNPMKLNEEDYEDENREGQLKTPTIPVKINGSYEYLPGNIEEREAYIEDELINCEVTTITVQPNPQEDGTIQPVVKIFTDGLHEKAY